jgi:putative two-component system response regulator
MREMDHYITSNPLSRVLVVDDQEDNRLVLEALLEDYYVVRTAENGAMALEYVASVAEPIDLVLLDVMMPDMDGYQVCQQIKNNPMTAHIPVMFLSGLDAAHDEEFGIKLGAADFIHKPFSPAVVLARVGHHLELGRAHRLLRRRAENLELLIAERTRKIREQSEALFEANRRLLIAQESTIIAFCALAEARDNDTGNHICRTQHYVRILAEALRSHPRFSDVLNDDVINNLFKSAPLHDIGKVAIPDAVLLKPGRLTPEEWVIMRQHSEAGREAISQVMRRLKTNDAENAFLPFALEIAHSHHERWDGMGYPLGLFGDQIPLSARLMAVADVYDALISKRVYKPPFTHEQAVSMICADRGTHFDPDIVDAFVRIAAQFEQISIQYRDE